MDADTGEEVANEDIVRGYKLDTDTFIEVTKDELDNVALESTRTIDIDEFVDRSENDPRYLTRPYYLRPDGPPPRKGDGVPARPAGALVQGFWSNAGVGMRCFFFRSTRNGASSAAVNAPAAISCSARSPGLAAGPFYRGCTPL